MARPKRKSTRAVPEIWDEVKGRVNVMLTPTAKALLQRQAKSHKLSASEYIERSVRSEAFRLYADDDLRLLASALSELIALHIDELGSTGLWAGCEIDTERMIHLGDRITALQALLNQLQPPTPDSEADMQ